MGASNVWWPNTTGKFWDLLSGIEPYMGTADGVFRTKALTDNQCITTTPLTSFGTEDGISFDLSRGSSIYKGSKLQPKALQSLPCIRY